MNARARTWRNQAILAGALFALGLTAYWLEYKRKPSREAADEQNKKLFALKDRQIPSFGLIDAKGGTRASFEFQCLDDVTKLCKVGDTPKWQVTAPEKFKGDDANINSVLSTLNTLVATEVIDLSEETAPKREALLREYGLDPASRSGSSARRAQVTTDKGTQVAHFGKTHPIGESIFALAEKDGKVDDTRVFVVPSYFKNQFEHELTYWRDKKILTLAAHEITRFELSGGKAPVISERTDGQWNLISKGQKFPGDIENIDNLLNAVGYLNAKGFPDKSALKGTTPALKLSLTAGNNTTVLTLYKRGDLKKGAGKLYATVSGLDPVFEVEPSTLDRFNREVRDLRLAKLITTMDRFGAKKLEWSGKPFGAEPLVLQAKDGKWLHDTKEVATDKITQLLDKLSGNRIREFVSGAAIPAGEDGGIRLKLSDDKGTVKRDLVFWKSGSAAATKLYARDLLNASATREALVIDGSLLTELPWTRESLLAPAAGAAK